MLPGWRGAPLGCKGRLLATANLCRDTHWFGVNSAVTVEQPFTGHGHRPNEQDPGQPDQDGDKDRHDVQ
jgi:hypothetical protein